MYPVVPSLSSNSAPPNWRLLLSPHRRKINEDLGSGRLAGRQHGGVGRGSAADLSELSEVTRAEGEDMETSREASGAQVSDAVGISPHARARAAWLLFSSRVQSAGQVSPTRLSLP